MKFRCCFFVAVNVDFVAVNQDFSHFKSLDGFDSLIKIKSLIKTVFVYLNSMFSAPQLRQIINKRVNDRCILFSVINFINQIKLNMMIK